MCTQLSFAVIDICFREHFGDVILACGLSAVYDVHIHQWRRVRQCTKIEERLTYAG